MSKLLGFIACVAWVAIAPLTAGPLLAWGRFPWPLWLRFDKEERALRSWANSWFSWVSFCESESCVRLTWLSPFSAMLSCLLMMEVCSLRWYLLEIPNSLLRCRSLPG